jgi:lysophospholipase L1-like esterase
MLACALLARCGGGGSSPAAPSTPAPPTYTVTATVFYDENGNGTLDAAEGARIPNAKVVVGAGSGTTAVGTGQASVTGIAEGSFTPQVDIGSLPYYYEPPATPLPAIAVPGTTEVRIPLTLSIGGNQRNLYFGYGDSITAGDGSSDGRGYQLYLQNLLGPYFARAEVTKFGRPGTDSDDGLSRIRTWLRTYSPSYVLILYGTNDWEDARCQGKMPPDCFTVDSLDGMIDVARDMDVLPVIATIIPANPALAAAGRNAWIDGINVHVKALARLRQVPLADLNAEMKATSPSLTPLFTDHVHPNDQGYQALARGWFKGITASRSAATAARRSFFRLP